MLARLLVGAFFIYMGLSKALDHPERFLNEVREYHLTTSPLLLNSIAVALPWFEVFCGLLLLAGIAVRGTSLVLAVLLICFTLAILHRALVIVHTQGVAFTAVKFDCGCGTGVVVTWHKLLENTFLILAALWLFAGRGRKLCVRYSLFEARRPPLPVS